MWKNLLKEKREVNLNLKMNLKRAQLILVLICCGPVLQAQDAKETILFTNVKVFNGTDEKLLDADVLVEGNMIKQVSEDNKAPKGTQVIDGGGRVLMPGMIEAHGHVTYSSSLPDMMLNHDANEQAIYSARRAQDYLMAGFTTIRDMGGNSFGLQKALDAGVLSGPRIYSSGPPISQTSGHGDFRTANDGHPYFDGPDLGGIASRFHLTRIADGPDEVHRRSVALMEIKKICSTAETYNVMVAPHNVGGIITTLATLHLMATIRNGKILEHFNDFTDQFVKQAGSPYPEVVDGAFSLPSGPGWGVELDLEAIAKYPPNYDNGIITDAGLNMFKKAEWNQRDSK